MLDPPQRGGVCAKPHTPCTGFNSRTNSRHQLWRPDGVWKFSLLHVDGPEEFVFVDFRVDGVAFDDSGNELLCRH